MSAQHPDPKLSRASVYDVVTERMLAKLDEGSIPWRRPWRDLGGHRNPIDIRGTAYRGINRAILTGMDYESPVWLTFKQAQELGGSVRRGERSTPVVFWKQVAAGPTEESEEHEGRRFILRYFSAFNLSQTEGVNVPEPIRTLLAQPQPTVELISAADAVVEGYAGCPPIHHGESRAYYRPSTDSVMMPTAPAFNSPDHYYATLFHELGHSTGHESRLARSGITDVAMFGSHEYSREELIAEFCSAFLAADCGINQPALDANSAAYIQSWARVLSSDRRLVVQAAQQAQRAADWIKGQRYTSTAE
jgi:antirestriction protein ArdC